MDTLVCKCILYFAILGMIANSAFAQTSPMGPPKKDPAAVPVETTPCNLTLKDLPSFTSVKMGMSYDEVLAVYPELANDKFFHKVDEHGYFRIGKGDVSEASILEDAIQLDVNFKNGTVYILATVYESAKWASIRDAVRDYSRLLGIAETSWRPLLSYAAELKCVDFTFYANSQAHEKRLNTMSIHPHIPKNK